LTENQIEIIVSSPDRAEETVVPATLAICATRALFIGALALFALPTMAAGGNPVPHIYPELAAIGIELESNRILSAQPIAEEADAAALMADADVANTACEAGDLSACTMLGKAYLDGRGRLRNRPVAELLFIQACDGDEAEACFWLGRLLTSIPSEQAQDRALAAHTKACQAVVLESCERGAVLRDRQFPTSLGQPRAGDMLRRFACQNGLQAACRQLAMNLAAVDRSPFAQAQGRSMLDPFCSSGDVEACEILSGAANASAGETEAPELQPVHRQADPPMRESYTDLALQGEACEQGTVSACPQAANLLLDEALPIGPAELVQLQSFAEKTCAHRLNLDCVRIARRMIEDEGIPSGRERGYALLDGACQQAEMLACVTFEQLAALDLDAPLPMVNSWIAPPDAEDEAQDRGKNTTAENRQCQEFLGGQDGQAADLCRRTVGRIARFGPPMSVSPTFARRLGLISLPASLEPRG
jgi:TPR repeat protein